MMFTAYERFSLRRLIQKELKSPKHLTNVYDLENVSKALLNMDEASCGANFRTKIWLCRCLEVLRRMGRFFETKIMYCGHSGFGQ